MSSQAHNFEKNLNKRELTPETNLQTPAETNLQTSDLWQKINLASNQIILISSDFYNMGTCSDPKRVEEIKQCAIQIEQCLSEIKTMV